MRFVDVALFAVFSVAQASNVYVMPPAALAPAPYAPWAHTHWVWLSSDGDNTSNQQNVSNLVKDYMQRNITVGAVDIDSGWSTGFNNFIVDNSSFPNLGALVSELHNLDVKVILWVTSMIDTDSSNFEYALNNSFFVTNAFESFSTLKWWHGEGGLLDYTNPAAVAWWHSQMDNVLSLGIDGWKVDGTDPFIIEYLEPHGHNGNVITYRDYANAYYGDFLNYTQQKNGPHCLIWSRPVDSFPLLTLGNQSLGAYLTFSPHDVMFSGWVGDQDPTFEGLQQAYTNIIYSAWYNYTNFGSDIGGYRCCGGPSPQPPLGRTKELFTRWYQAMAFMPLMENGGDNEHRPWMFDNNGTTDTTDNYRMFVNAHLELGPYLYATGSAAFESNTSSITPRQSVPEDLWLLQLVNIQDYSYFLGANILVQPIVNSNISWIEVAIPAGTASWYNWFQPSQVYSAGSVINASCPLTTTPVFGRTGSIIPLNVSTSDVGHGDCSFAGSLTLYIHTPAAVGSTQEVREFQAGGLVVTYVVEDSRSVPGASDVVFTTTAHAWPLTLLLRGVEASSKSTVTVTASPNLGGVETFEVKEAAHPGGLLAGGMPSCGVQPGLMWSTATSVSTRSGLPEVVVRLPAAVTVGGSVSRIAGVFI